MTGSLGSHELPVRGSLGVARWGTAVAGFSALVSAGIGLRYGSRSLYQSDDLLLVQIYGQDLLVVAAVLPLLAISVWAAARGSARGLVGWAGALIYLAYWYHYLLGAATFSAVYLLHVLLVGSSLFTLAVLGASLDVERFAHRFAATMQVRVIGGLLIGAGTIFAAAALADIAIRLHEGEVLGNSFRSVYTVDLTIMLPLTIAAGVLLARRHSWGFALAGPLIVNAALSVATVLTAAIALLRSGIPDRGAVSLLLVPTVILTSLSALFLRRIRV